MLAIFWEVIEPSTIVLPVIAPPLTVAANTQDYRPTFNDIWINKNVTDPIEHTAYYWVDDWVAYGFSIDTGLFVQTNWEVIEPSTIVLPVIAPPLTVVLIVILELPSNIAVPETPPSKVIALGFFNLLEVVVNGHLIHVPDDDPLVQFTRMKGYVDATLTDRNNIIYWLKSTSSYIYFCISSIPRNW